MTTLVLLAFLASSSASAPGVDTAGPVVGRVVDSRTGQPIEKARVWTPADETVTDREGRFALPRPQGGTLELSVSAVGYGVARRTIGGDTEELQIRLGQDAVRYSETLDVQPLPFDREPDAPLARGLQNLELRNLSSVIADDALRSVQAMPGVSGNDDYYASFSVRGWGFEKAGLQIDGVLVSSPFHTIRDVNDGYSLSIVNNDVIAELTLFAGAAPARFGDRVGAALAIETRDGTRERTTGRASLGAAGASVFVEGPLGRSGTSWLFGARKSFLDLRRQGEEASAAFVAAAAADREARRRQVAQAVRVGQPDHQHLGHLARRGEGRGHRDSRREQRFAVEHQEYGVGTNRVRMRRRGRDQHRARFAENARRDPECGTPAADAVAHRRAGVGHEFLPGSRPGQRCGNQGHGQKAAGHRFLREPWDARRPRAAGVGAIPRTRRTRGPGGLSATAQGSDDARLRTARSARTFGAAGWRARALGPSWED